MDQVVEVKAQKSYAFNQEQTDHLSEPLFLGNGVNVQRYDQVKYPNIDGMTAKQKSFFWSPDEVDGSKDRVQFTQLPDNEKHIFISNLKYQILLDSVQGRSPSSILLPLASLPEVEAFIDWWTAIECLAEGTEVLTPKGWKDLSLVTTDDEVLVYDSDNATSWFEKPKRTMSYTVDNKEMIQLAANNEKQFHQFVTPNHRMPIQMRTKRLDLNKQNYFIEARDWISTSQRLAPVSTIKLGEKHELTPLEKILIAAQADGTWYPNRYTGERCGTVPVFFCLSKKRKIERLHSLALEAGVNIRLLEVTAEKGNVKEQYRYRLDLPINPKEIDIKDFSSWVDLSAFSKSCALMFLNELSYWDAHRKLSSKGEITVHYHTTVKVNSDIVQAVAALAGKHARYKLKKDERSDRYKDVHSLSIINRAYKDCESINSKKVNYTGKVYCLETSTGAFLVRYKNVVSVTGNSIHSASYTHIIRNVFPEPGPIFDDIMVNEAILERASSISKYYDDLHVYSLYYQLLGEGTHTVNGEKITINKQELMKRLYLCMFSVQVLEAVRFYGSFLCSFAFGQHGVMEGNAKIIKLIAR